MDPSAQLKYLAPFLDTHLLHHLLKHNAATQTTELRNQLKAKQLGANKVEALKQEAAAAAKAQKLVTLL